MSPGLSPDSPGRRPARRGGARGMGDRIDFRDGRWVVPDRPVIPYIEGDGTGPDIWRASQRVFDAVLTKVSGGKRQVEWLEVLAGEKAFKQTGNWLPEETLE